MKNIYTKVSILLLFFTLQLYLPAKLDAQCLCSAGVPATPIVQTITIPPTTVSTLSFNFQQFNPSIGTLSCVSFADTVTGISYTGARNTGPDSTAFLFLLSLSTKISGPGILISHPFTQTYGYDTLAQYGSPGDTITYGPANIITNPIGTGSTGANGAYLGVGTVPFTFAINGGMITLDGGSNYKSAVSTTIGGTMSLTYYYCPVVLLASNLQNFTANKKYNNIVLKWDAQNAAETDHYDIEYSIDGKEFISVAQIAANNNTNTYDYNYTLNGNSSGYVYFRIKQTSINDKTGYSPIQKINLNDKTTTGISIHPNPAVNGLSLTFDHLLTGDYSVDLVNTAGQVIFNKKVKLTNSNTIPVNWTNKPAPGMYFTRVTNTATREQQIIRAVIR
ncbi:MAG: choice-of-anchor E domain-containing protein [Bacteroidota bacterium]